MKLRFVCMMGSAFLFASAVGAQTKVSGQHKCDKAPEVVGTADAGDKPGHSLAVVKNTCKWTTPMEMEGGKTTDGTSVAFLEMTATRASSNGTYVGNMDSGDKYFVSFRDSGPAKDGKPGVTKGTWSYTGGTGKLKGITGKGTYTVTPNADGGAVVDVEGEYSIAAGLRRRRRLRKRNRFESEWAERAIQKPRCHSLRIRAPDFLGRIGERGARSHDYGIGLGVGDVAPDAAYFGAALSDYCAG